MRNTLLDSEFKEAQRAVEDLLDDIYCTNCESESYLEMASSKDFVYAVLNAIGIEY